MVDTLTKYPDGEWRNPARAIAVPPAPDLGTYSDTYEEAYA